MRKIFFLGVLISLLGAHLAANVPKADMADVTDYEYEDKTTGEGKESEVNKSQVEALAKEEEEFEKNRLHKGEGVPSNVHDEETAKNRPKADNASSAVQEKTKLQEETGEKNLFADISSSCPTYPLSESLPELSQCNTSFSELKSSNLEQLGIRQRICLVTYLALKVICSQNDDQVNTKELLTKIHQRNVETSCRDFVSTFKAIDCKNPNAIRVFDDQKTCELANILALFISRQENDCNQQCKSEEYLCQHFLESSELMAKYSRDMHIAVVPKGKKSQVEQDAERQEIKDTDSNLGKEVKKTLTTKSSPSLTNSTTTQTVSSTDIAKTSVSSNSTEAPKEKNETKSGANNAKVQDDKSQVPEPPVDKPPKSPVAKAPESSDNQSPGDQSQEKEQTFPYQNHMQKTMVEAQSSFFAYFVFMAILCIVFYLVFHNKSKIIALILEGKRKRNGRRGRGGSSAHYRKLDNNLEEAMADSSGESIRHVIY